MLEKEMMEMVIIENMDRKLKEVVLYDTDITLMILQMLIG